MILTALGGNSLKLEGNNPHVQQEEEDQPITVYLHRDLSAGQQGEFGNHSDYTVWMNPTNVVLVRKSQIYRLKRA